MPSSANTVRVIDRGMKRIQDVLAAIAHDGAVVKVGVFGAAAQAPREPEGEADRVMREMMEEHGLGGEWSPMTNAKLAVIHEFGTRDGRIPERSFIRSTMAQHRAQYEELLRRLVREAVFAGRVSYERALALIGEKMASDVRAKIRSGIPPPNAPSTLARKLKRTRKGSLGQPIPLIDTGRLLNAISYEVVRDATGGALLLTRVSP